MPASQRFDASSDIGEPEADRTALFLDFDGTLVDIADHPGGVEVPAELPHLLMRLGERFAGGVTLISGRAIRDIDTFLPGHAGPVIGGHGAESRRGTETRGHPFASDPRLPAMFARARDWALGRKGVLVEEKPTGLGIHYRHARDEEAAARAFLEELIDEDPALEVHAAKLAFEIRPRDAEKGASLVRALAESGAERAIMIGDDATDEPAMRAAQASGGMAIKVGPGETAADWRLEDPAAVRRLLAAWAEGTP